MFFDKFLKETRKISIFLKISNFFSIFWWILTFFDNFWHFLTFFDVFWYLVGAKFSATLDFTWKQVLAVILMLNQFHVKNLINKKMVKFPLCEIKAPLFSGIVTFNIVFFRSKKETKIQFVFDRRPLCHTLIFFWTYCTFT